MKTFVGRIVTVSDGAGRSYSVQMGGGAIVKAPRLIASWVAMTPHPMGQECNTYKFFGIVARQLTDFSRYPVSHYSARKSALLVARTVL